MKTTFLLLTLALSSFTLKAADTCEAQLAAKDELIKSLTQTIQTMATNGGNGTVVVNTQAGWTCEAVCVQNLLGKSFGKPGKLFQSSILVSDSNPEKAFNRMIQKCQEDTQATYNANTDKYSEGQVGGYMTKEEMNSPEWESKMVESFKKKPTVAKFCRKS